MSFKLPEKSDWMVEQNNHTATLEYAQEINKVALDFGYNKAMEVGCVWGVSTLSILLAQAYGTLLSVDFIDKTNPRMHAYTEVRLNSLLDRWDFYHGRSEQFWSENKSKFDFIYIDGSHDYKDVRLDLFAAWICLEKGGMLLTDDYLHDHNHDHDYGVSLAALELMYHKQIKPMHLGKHCIGFVK